MALINPREVLEHLNELGFHNITREQLKVFLQDLKRLIKYESKSKEKENEPPCPCNSETTHYALPTKSWLTKQRELGRGKVLLEVNRPLPHCSADGNSTVCSGKNSTRTSGPCSNLSPCGSHCVLYKTHGSSAPDILRIDDIVNPPSRAKSCESFCKPKNPVKYKRKTVIHPRAPPKITKCDPVTLYHKYQEQWKKYSIPGESDHADLRWSIRERLLGQPELVSSSSLETVSKKHSARSTCPCD
uniref:Centriolar and ciliogenesis-associated protein HYLS1 C-terminal domain-containing protein n=1 Tax=Photinus pyralis TaxID=7054 RepID=A0A1Y1LET5_PHOPY